MERMASLLPNGCDINDDPWWRRMREIAQVRSGQINPPFHFPFGDKSGKLSRNTGFSNRLPWVCVALACAKMWAREAKASIFSALKPQLWQDVVVMFSGGIGMRA